MRVNKKNSKEATDLRVSRVTKVQGIRSASPQAEKKYSHVDDSDTSEEKIAIDEWAENIDAGPMLPIYSESDDFEFLPVCLSSTLPCSETIYYMPYPEPSSAAAELILEVDSNNNDKVASECWFNIKEIPGNNFDIDLCTTKLNWFDLIDSSFFGLPGIEIADIGIDVTMPEDLGTWLPNKETHHADYIMVAEETIMTEMDIIGIPDLENWFDIVERRFDEELASYQMGTVH